MPDYSFSYKGTKRINDVLEYRGLDEHIQKMLGFDEIYIQEASSAVDQAVGIAEARAEENAPVLTGGLKGSIYGKRLSILKASLTVRGAIGTNIGIRGLVNEVGRWRGTGTGRRFWKGKFYLYYGVADKAKEIMALYVAANQRIVNRLVVNP